MQLQIDIRIDRAAVHPVHWTSPMMLVDFTGKLSRQTVDYRQRYRLRWLLDQPDYWTCGYRLLQLPGDQVVDLVRSEARLRAIPLDQLDGFVAMPRRHGDQDSFWSVVPRYIYQHYQYGAGRVYSVAITRSGRQDLAASGLYGRQQVQEVLDNVLAEFADKEVTRGSSVG